ncbi:MAG: hypothetical protein ACJAXZ_004296 [Akkermansiaceae bacterium]|jgi:hypothetical protein
MAAVVLLLSALFGKHAKRAGDLRERDCEGDEELFDHVFSGRGNMPFGAEKSIPDCSDCYC